MILDRNGIPYGKLTNFGEIDRVCAQMWSKNIAREMVRNSYLESFIGVTLYDQFGYEVKYIREGKGNIIEAGGDKIRFGMRMEEIND